MSKQYKTTVDDASGKMNRCEDSIKLSRHRQQQASYYQKLKSTKDGHRQFNDMHRQRMARTRAKSARTKLLKVRDELLSQLSASQRSHVNSETNHYRQTLESDPNFHLIDRGYKEDIKKLRLENKFVKYETSVMKKVLGGKSLPDFPPFPLPNDYQNKLLDGSWTSNSQESEILQSVRFDEVDETDLDDSELRFEEISEAVLDSCLDGPDSALQAILDLE